MSSYLNNLVLKRNLLVNLDHNISYDISRCNLYQSFFNECRKNLLNKEIKFENISTKKKKKDDENLISTNFKVNNLLNILNQKKIKLDSSFKKNTNFLKQKKKLDESIKKMPFDFLKNKDKINLEKNEKKNKIFENHIKYSEHKNKDLVYNNLNTTNLSKTLFNKNAFKKTKSLNIIKNKENFIKDNNNKNFIYFKNSKNNISNISSSNNIQKNNNSSINLINSCKKIDENNFIKLNKKAKVFLNFKENIHWKKAIRQQILLSISNKKNQAEISLKPESLGSIHVKIKMKADQAELKFISDHMEIKEFLNHCVPFLRNALNKNGILLKKVNIFSSSNKQKNTSSSILEFQSIKSNVMKQFYKNLIHKKNINLYV